MKLCIVTSPGGHLSKIIKLKPWWSRHQRVFVTEVGTGQTFELDGETIIAGHFPENRNLINFLKNLVLATIVLRRYRPEVIVSMGAGIAVPFFLVGKLFGCRLLFIETFMSIPQPTLTGRLLYPFVDNFVIQHAKLRSVYPKADVCEWRL